jgi:hypothetical protein
VYLDTRFFEALSRTVGVRLGDFAQAYVVAHEVGHHVQFGLGILQRVAAADEQDSAGANARSVRVELQADCLAGIWKHATYRRGQIGEAEVAEALRAAAVIGDDFRRPDVDVDVSGAREGAAVGGRGLAEFEGVLREAKSPRYDEQERGGEGGEVHLGGVSRVWRPESERASCAIHERHGGGRDRDEPEQQSRHDELEREREDEEADVLAEVRLRDAEGLPVPPEQERLPLPGGRRREEGRRGE